DTDVIKYSDSIFRDNFNSISAYGDVILVIKDRGQFNKTNHSGENKATSSKQMELFKTGIVNGNHYGIRTGVPSTEIDAIVIEKDRLNDIEFIDNIKYHIAQKGFYIPICDKKGKVVYSPEEYDNIRKTFSGIEKFHGPEIVISTDWENTKFSKEIRKSIASKEEKDEIISIRSGLSKEIETI